MKGKIIPAAAVLLLAGGLLLSVTGGRGAESAAAPEGEALQQNNVSEITEASQTPYESAEMPSAACAEDVIVPAAGSEGDGRAYVSPVASTPGPSAPVISMEPVDAVSPSPLPSPLPSPSPSPLPSETEENKAEAPSPSEKPVSEASPSPTGEDIIGGVFFG